MRADKKFIKPFNPNTYAFEAKDLKRWREQNLSWQQIARKYGCCHTTVIHAAKRLGVFQRRALKGPM